MPTRIEDHRLDQLAVSQTRECADDVHSLRMFAGSERWQEWMLI